MHDVIGSLGQGTWAETPMATPANAQFWDYKASLVLDRRFFFCSRQWRSCVGQTILQPEPLNFTVLRGRISAGGSCYCVLCALQYTYRRWSADLWSRDIGFGGRTFYKGRECALEAGLPHRSFFLVLFFFVLLHLTARLILRHEGEE